MGKDTPPDSSFFGMLIFNVSLLSLFLLSLVLCLFDAEKPLPRELDVSTIRQSLQPQWKVIFLVSLSFLWWLATYTGTEIFQMLLDDRTCHRHHRLNSVSGHYLFFTFWGLNSLWLCRFVSPLRVDNPFKLEFWRTFIESKTVLKYIAYLAMIFLAAGTITIARTWLFGYHTLRQVLYGALGGVASQYFLSNLLENGVYGDEEQRKTTNDTFATILGVFVLGSIVVEYVLGLFMHVGERQSLVTMQLAVGGLGAAVLCKVAHTRLAHAFPTPPHHSADAKQQ